MSTTERIDGPLDAITTLLPVSMETLTFAPLIPEDPQSYSEPVFEELFQDSSQDVREALPSLGKINFQYDRPLSLKTTDKLQKLGIIVEGADANLSILPLL